MSFAWRTSSLLLILAFVLFSATGIREIDFKNFDYAWDAPKLGPPEAWNWLELTPRSSTRVVGGIRNFSPSESPEGSYRGGHLAILSVTYGDLNGDGQDDAAVDMVFSTGGTLNWHYVDVFTLRKGLPTLLGRLQSGSRADGGLLKVAITQGMLVLDFADTLRRIADCCSEGYVRVRYRWQDGHFVEGAKREFGDLDDWKKTADLLMGHLVANRIDEVLELMEPEFIKGIGTRSAAHSAIEHLFEYCGRPLDSQFQREERGVKRYLDGRRQELRKFFYDATTNLYAKGVCSFSIGVVASETGDGHRVTEFGPLKRGDRK